MSQERVKCKNNFPNPYDVPKEENEALYTLSFLRTWTINFDPCQALTLCSLGYEYFGKRFFTLLRELCLDYRNYALVSQYAVEAIEKRIAELDAIDAAEKAKE